MIFPFASGGGFFFIPVRAFPLHSDIQTKKPPTNGEVKCACEMIATVRIGPVFVSSRKFNPQCMPWFCEYSLLFFTSIISLCYAFAADV